MTQVDAWRMVRKRALAAPLGNHSFRATGITAYLANGGTLEHAQSMAAHESPRTTKLYDRTKERLTQDEIEVGQGPSPGGLLAPPGVPGGTRSGFGAPIAPPFAPYGDDPTEPGALTGA